MNMNMNNLFLTNNGRVAEMLSFQHFSASSEEELEILEQARLFYGEIGTADADLFISQELDALAYYLVIARDVETGNVFDFICNDIAGVDFV